MKVCFLTNSVSRRAGGLFSSVRILAQTIDQVAGAEVDVFGVRDEHTEIDCSKWSGMRLHVFQRYGPASFGFAPNMARALRDLNPDLVHTQGLWTYPSVAAYRWARTHRRPYLVTPRGMLDSWAVRNAAWKKRLAGFAYERGHLERAACLHALCEAEAEAIREFGLRNPLCIIPNGIDRPEIARKPPNWRSALPAGSRILLYLGRLHPKKGLNNLLNAWRLAVDEARAKEWQLVITGWDQMGHEARLKEQVNSLGLADSVGFIGPQFGEDKTATYGCADAFVLPSFSEGLPMTILEAWSHELPVLMTQACNIPEGFTAGAALKIETDPEAMAEVLKMLFEKNEIQRKAMGARGLQLVAERLQWSKIANDMTEVYRWVLGAGEMPKCVFVD